MVVILHLLTHATALDITEEGLKISKIIAFF